MTTHTEVTIIRQGGKPVFAVVPYAEFLRLTGRAPRVPKGDAVPHEVMGLVIQSGHSLLRAWREYLGLTQTEVAERLGVSQASVAKTETARSPRHSTLKRYAEALGLQVEQLI